MKLVLLSVFFMLTVAGICVAQNFSQQGESTQVMQTGGMTAAHPSLPIGSRARVTNVATGEHIEVTIVGRIPPAVDRIVDLSPAAATALNLAAGGTVLISTGDPPAAVAAAPEPDPAPEPAPPPPVVATAAPSPEPEPEPAREPEPVQVAEAPAQTQPVSITIHNYIVVPDQPEEPPMQWNLAPAPRANIVDARPAVPSVTYAPPPPPPPAVVVPETPILSWAPPAVNSVMVVPGLPSPNSNRIYRLQVGSYSGNSGADAAMRRVEAAGFNAMQESFNNRLRVIAVDIPASNVEAAVQRLAAMGFSEIWVRE